IATIFDASITIFEKKRLKFITRATIMMFKTFLPTSPKLSENIALKATTRRTNIKNILAMSRSCAHAWLTLLPKPSSSRFEAISITENFTTKSKILPEIPNAQEDNFNKTAPIPLAKALKTKEPAISWAAFEIDPLSPSVPPLQKSPTTASSPNPDPSAQAPPPSTHLTQSACPPQPVMVFD